MEADWASVWVGGASGAVAVIALAVSVWAVLVSRRAAKSAAEQTDVAKRSYRLASQPAISLELDVSTQTQSHMPGKLKYAVTVTRKSGPFAVEVQSTHSAGVAHDAHSYYSTTIRRPDDLDVEPDPDGKLSASPPRWRRLAGNDYFRLGSFFKNPEQWPVYALYVAVEYRVREEGSTDPETWWYSKEYLEWQNPDYEHVVRPS